MLSGAAALLVLSAWGAAPEAPRARMLVAATVAPSKQSAFDVESAAVAKSAARAAAYALDLEPIALEDAGAPLERSLSLCGADPRCIGARLDGSGLSLGLFLVANLSTTPRLITARLIDAQGAVTQSAVWEYDFASGDIASAIASDTWDLLDRSGHAVGGRLVIETKPADSALFVADARGAPVASQPANVYLVPPGEYRLRASKDGYLEAAGRAVAQRGRDTHVAMALEDAPSIVSSPWLWAGIGAAIAGAAGALVILHHNSGSLTLCQTPNHAMCP